MQLKCNYCDPTVTKKMKEEGIKPTKSINTEIDEFVKDDKGKYYHSNCYLQHLIKSKKLNTEEAKNNLEIQKKIIEAELKEMKDKDRFYSWIKSYYESSLPAYFCTKINEIVKGVHEKVNEPIPYYILLDIYEKMEKYLRKKAANINFKNTGQRMNYDLAVVIGNYGDYKKYIEKQKIELEKAKMATVTISDQKKIDIVIKKKESKDEEFNLSDALDDLLL